MWMTETTYYELLKWMSPHIQKEDTNKRQAINAHEGLSVTLRFLATGRSYIIFKFF